MIEESRCNGKSSRRTLVSPIAAGWFLTGLALLAFTGCASRPPASLTRPAPIEEATAVQSPEAAGSSAPVEKNSAHHRATVPDGSAPVASMEDGQLAAARAAHYAVQMIGRPYRSGGTTPSTGFDCSGLIQFSFRQAGIMIPRSTDEQRYASRLVRGSHLRRGDLLFFDQEGKKNSHAGIYIGDGYFVHAPSSGKRVRMDRIDSPYWRGHLSEARRFNATSAAPRHVTHPGRS